MLYCEGSRLKGRRDPLGFVISRIDAQQQGKREAPSPSPPAPCPYRSPNVAPSRKTKPNGMHDVGPKG